MLPMRHPSRVVTVVVALLALTLIPVLAGASQQQQQEQQQQQDQQQQQQQQQEDAADAFTTVGLLTKDGDSVPEALRSGPYATASTEAALTIGEDVTPACQGGCKVKLYVTSPVRTASLGPASVPIVLMFSGFQLPASYYAVYAHALATWGFAALRYDLPGKLLRKVIRDDEEIKFVPVLIQWLSEQYHDPASALYEVLDFKRVGGFGHSRGAKLAALGLAGGVGGMSTAVLVDPVDLTSFTKKQGYPSAVEALTQHPHKAMLIGAGISGWCNPADQGWSVFWPVLSPGSWLQRVLPAGHMQFLDAKGVSAWGLDRLCGAGNVTHKTVIHLTQGAAVCWLMDTFRHDESEALVKEWLSWAPQQTDVLEWSVKPGGATAANVLGGEREEDGTRLQMHGDENQGEPALQAAAS